MNNLYWIDDSPHDMSLIVDNVFPDLWDNDISSSVILFGNAYCQKEDENGPTKEDCEGFRQKIIQRFSWYCTDIDDDEWNESGTAYRNKKELIENCNVNHISICQANNSGFSVEDLVKNWTDEDYLNKILECNPDNIENFLKESEMAVDDLIKAMNIPNHAAVAMDIYLLYHDNDRISKNLPNISMALYHSLSKRKHGCYVYSSMASSKQILDIWKNVYAEVFSKDIPHVFHKFGLITIEKNTDEKKKLVELVKHGRKNDS